MADSAERVVAPDGLGNVPGGVDVYPRKRGLWTWVCWAGGAPNDTVEGKMQCAECDGDRDGDLASVEAVKSGDDGDHRGRVEGDRFARADAPDQGADRVTGC